ncbi:unnamed protein product [Polarella glacialis]|uniref:Uncharacterized protein n=1 Tax=Polarella glacialis TaxID=89957 RepID=A0A813K8Z1_POLGL|nr:unnamed protein product [Polarella glacialis]CAE8697339.1 unnamed protein product [Polarella glacialis]
MESLTVVGTDTPDVEVAQNGRSSMSEKSEGQTDKESASNVAAQDEREPGPLLLFMLCCVGTPLVFLQFYGIPAGDGSFWACFAIIAGFGILRSWAQSGTNFLILSDIVPSRDRSKVIAWECALENSIAHAIGPIFVAVLAEKCFDYTFGEVDASGKSLHSATALGKAMTATICIPWLVYFFACSILHWSYPRDMKRQAQDLAAKNRVNSPEKMTVQAVAVTGTVTPVAELTETVVLEANSEASPQIPRSRRLSTGHLYFRREDRQFRCKLQVRAHACYCGVF